MSISRLTRMRYASVAGIRHIDGGPHFRTSNIGCSAVVATFHDRGWPVEFDVRYDDVEDAPMTMAVSTTAPVPDEDIAAALAERFWSVTLFEAFYDSSGGPLVKFRLACPPTVGRTVRVVHTIDYGFDDGAWVCTAPDFLDVIRIELFRRDIAIVTDTGGALAVNAAYAGRLNRALRRAGLFVFDDVFRPSDWGDDED